MTWSRRRVLRAGGALAGVSAASLLVGTARAYEAAAGQDAAVHLDPTGHPTTAGDQGVAAPRRIMLLNLHTDEHLEVEYFRAGAYLPEAMSAIEVLLRDFRNGERRAMDPHLMDYLVEVARSLGADPAFSVISGYRSPQTNASLREHGTGVAQHSLHMEGRAIDVRMKGIDCASLAAHAVDMKRGGVGYYRASDFVHLDTGAFRTWKG
jgi:uncharacterized protein YcbK (DUF882 family)